MEDSNLDMNLASVARFDKAGCRVVYDADGNTLVETTLTNDLYIFDMRDYEISERKRCHLRRTKTCGIVDLVTAANAISWLR